MPDVRALFIAALDRAVDVAGRPEVAARWDEPSALPELTVRGLAGHLCRTATVVLQYLDAPEPGPEHLLDASQYYAAVMTKDIYDAGNTGVRERGEEFAAAGHDGVIATARAARDALARRLADEPTDRRVAVIGGLRLNIDEYVATRLVEVVVHTDDLAVSVGIESPEPEPAAASLVVDTVLGVARIRHGDLAILRALVRAERDEINPFPVF